MAEIRKTFRFVFYTSICIMLSLNRKKDDSGLKILILISGGAQIRRHICIVDLYRWLNENNKTNVLSLLLNTFLLNSNY